MRLWLLRNRLRVLFGLPPLPPPHADPVPPVPRVVPSLRGALPGAVVRLVPGAVVLVLATLAGASDGWWLLAGAGAVALTGWPRPEAAAVVVAVMTVWLLAQGDLLLADPATRVVAGVWRLSTLVLLVHLLLVATSLAAHVAWRALVEVAVLARAARSVLAAQAVAQSAVLLVAWVRAGIEGSQGGLRLLAVVAAVAAVVVALPREWRVRAPRRQRL